MTLSISNNVVNYYYIKLCLKRDDAISYPVQFLYYKQNILKKSSLYISSNERAIFF